MSTNIKSENNITFTIDNFTLSVPAYEEFYKLRTAIEQSKSFNDWDYNPYFLIALYDYYKATNNGRMSSKVKAIIKNLDWLFDGANLYTYESDGQYEVTVRKYEGNTYHDKRYTGNKAFEVIRDMCLPVILNYK